VAITPTGTHTIDEINGIYSRGVGGTGTLNVDNTDVLVIDPPATVDPALTIGRSAGSFGLSDVTTDERTNGRRGSEG
jgi:hypothetical protein